jgi:hypothetical protein
MGIKLKTGILLIAGMVLFLQKNNFANDNPWFKDKDKMVGNSFHIELLGGGILPFTRYKPEAYNELETKQLILFETGLIFRFQRGKWFSWLPGIKYLQHGSHIVSPYEYKLKANYLTFSLPVEWAFEIERKYKKSTSALILFAGPYIASPISGSVTGEGFQEDIFQNSFTRFNYGIEGGFGFRIQTFSLSDKSNINLRVSWMQGFNDAFAPEEIISPPAAYDQFNFLEGKRIISGLKVTLSFEISFKSKKIVSFTAGGDGKKNYKKFVIIDEK